MKINDRIVDVEERARLMTIAHKMGCTVYQHNPEKDTWFYYTDGTNVGYAEFSRRDSASLSSVHKPSRRVGTGFKITGRWEHIDENLMRIAMTMHAPGWASDSDRRAVVKWRDWNEFKNSSPWNAGHEEVTE